MRGQIIAYSNDIFEVLTATQTYRTRGVGLLRHAGEDLLVGDWVELNDQLMISKIWPRRNELVRPRVANVDQMVIVVAAAAPRPDWPVIYKLLALAEYWDLNPLLVWTKDDLAPGAPPFADDIYPWVAASLLAPLPRALLAQLEGRLSVLTGLSGVGKSSLISRLSPTAQAVSGAVSVKSARGKHTTRGVRIYPLGVGGGLIDTPGFSLLELTLSPTQLARSYRDFRALAAQCKFKNCLHAAEQSSECNVKQAVARGTVNAARYHFYLKLLSGLAT